MIRKIYLDAANVARMHVRDGRQQGGGECVAFEVNATVIGERFCDRHVVAIVLAEKCCSIISCEEQGGQQVLVLNAFGIDAASAGGGRQPRAAN